MKTALQFAGIGLLTLATAACSRAPNPRLEEAASTPAVEAAAEPAPAATAPVPAANREAWPLVVVHKSPTCGCCKAWVRHLEGAGFTVEVRDTEALDAVKQRVGIPSGKGSCHTAEVGGYFVEGHVPADDIKRLLAEKPTARGLTVPGMPTGSPGMEVPGVPAQAYEVELVSQDGSTQVFQQH